METFCRPYHMLLNKFSSSALYCVNNSSFLGLIKFLSYYLVYFIADNVCNMWYENFIYRWKYRFSKWCTNDRCSFKVCCLGKNCVFYSKQRKQFKVKWRVVVHLKNKCTKVWMKQIYKVLIIIMNYMWMMIFWWYFGLFQKSKYSHKLQITDLLQLNELCLCFYVVTVNECKDIIFWLLCWFIMWWICQCSFQHAH